MWCMVHVRLRNQHAGLRPRAFSRVDVVYIVHLTPKITFYAKPFVNGDICYTQSKAMIGTNTNRIGITTSNR